jgi:receptor protein-tyrosine kinase/non-specific protein-tyrosine kinase
MKISSSSLSSSDRLGAYESVDGGRSSVEVRYTVGVPLPNLIPRRLIRGSETLMLDERHSLAAERFRRLKSALSHQDPNPQVIAVTSSVAEEGKSMVATNLAMAFARDHEGEVLLIDGDLRDPSLHLWVEPQPQLGLSDVIAGRARVDDAMLTLENSTLKIIPAGSRAEDPIGLVTTRRFEEFLHTLRTRFKWIVIDTPPAVPFADAGVIGQATDGVLVVARSEATPKRAFVETIDALGSARILGAVRNAATPSVFDRLRGEHRLHEPFYAPARRPRPRFRRWIPGFRW